MSEKLHEYFLNTDTNLTNHIDVGAGGIDEFDGPMGTSKIWSNIIPIHDDMGFGRTPHQVLMLKDSFIPLSIYADGDIFNWDIGQVVLFDVCKPHGLFPRHVSRRHIEQLVKMHIKDTNHYNEYRKVIAPQVGRYDPKLCDHKVKAAFIGKLYNHITPYWKKNATILGESLRAQF